MAAPGPAVPPSPRTPPEVSLPREPDAQVVLARRLKTQTAPPSTPPPSREINRTRLAPKISIQPSVTSPNPRLPRDSLRLSTAIEPLAAVLASMGQVVLSTVVRTPSSTAMRRPRKGPRCSLTPTTLWTRRRLRMRYPTARTGSVYYRERPPRIYQKTSHRVIARRAPFPNLKPGLKPHLAKRLSVPLTLRRRRLRNARNHV